MRTVILLLSLFIAADAFPQAAGSFEVAPAPGWVAAIERPGPAPASEAAGTEWLLRDDQILADGQTVRYSRRALRIGTTAGVQNWQEIEIDFDPTFQRLVLHHVEVFRGSVAIDALRPEEVRVIQRETDLAERIYDGRMTALLFLHDLRPGDVIDYAWSLAGTNPILAGQFVDHTLLAHVDPAARLHWRLLHPTARAMRALVLDSKAEISEKVLPDGLTEKRILVEPAVAIELEDQLPSWHNPLPRVQTSEFGSWNAVARWAGDLFDQALEPSDDAIVEATLRMLQGRGRTDEERALAAVRFVQDEIRYLGIESGPNSHKPHPPSLVLTRRFGDCKDKALLLVRLLDRLGFDARVALVDSAGGRELSRGLPSPFLFDHAVVVVRDGQRESWIDATVSDAGGALWNLAPPDLDKALLVDAATTTLASIPQRRTASSTHVVEKWTLEEDGAARFNVETVYQGADADELRSFLSTLSREELGEQYRDYYAQADPEIELDGLPSVKDDREDNVIVVREAYRLARFWAESTERELWAHVIGNRLITPSTTRRTHPLALTKPSPVVHEIQISGSQDLSFATFDRTVDNEAFLLHARSWREGGAARFRFDWQPRQDAVAPAKLPQYAAAVREAEGALSVTVRRSALALAGLGFLAPVVPAVLTGGAVAAGGSLLLAGVLIRRRKKSGSDGMPHVNSLGQVGGLAAAHHCGMDGIPVSGSGRTVGQTPEGAPLVRLAVVCPQCLRSRPITVILNLGGRAHHNQDPAPNVDRG